jgi:dihydroorotate dehydrogenase
MGTKTVKYNKQGINQLPNDKPVLYRIKTESGILNYVGIAERGRVRERISEHLKEIPGAKVQIEQFSIINDAGKKEINVIRRTVAKLNKPGK